MLARLYGDPVAEGQFQKDRAKFLRTAKLAPRERNLLVAGDVAGLRAYLGAEEGKAHIVDSALAHIVDSALGEELVAAVIIDSAIESARATTRSGARKPAKKRTPKGRKPRKR